MITGATTVSRRLLLSLLLNSKLHCFLLLGVRLLLLEQFFILLKRRNKEETIAIMYLID